MKPTDEELKLQMYHSFRRANWDGSLTVAFMIIGMLSIIVIPAAYNRLESLHDLLMLSLFLSAPLGLFLLLGVGLGIDEIMKIDKSLKNGVITKGIIVNKVKSRKGRIKLLVKTGQTTTNVIITNEYYNIIENGDDVLITVGKPNNVYIHKNIVPNAKREIQWFKLQLASAKAGVDH